MFRRRIFWGLGALLFVAAVFVVGRVSADRNDAAILLAVANPSLAERLSDDDMQRRGKAYTAAIKEHEQRVATLLVLAGQDRKQIGFLGTRECAINLLAQYGAREAIPMHVRSIEYFAGGIVTDASPLNGYPCALALRRIGLSAQPEVLTFLRTTAPEEVSDDAIKLYAYLMLSLYGTNEGGHEEAIEVVRRTTERTSERRRENMQRLLDQLNAIVANYQPKPAAPAAE